MGKILRLGPELWFVYDDTKKKDDAKKDDTKKDTTKKDEMKK